jgi:alkylation response protein AidB-like acyl-CoA dehydrogenase
MGAPQTLGGQWLAGPPATGEVFTPERFTAEHRLMARTVRTWLQQEIEPLDTRLEQKDLVLLRDVLQKAGALGIFAVDVPSEYGGMESDRIAGLILAETVSRGSVSSTVGAHVTIGMLPIVFFGTSAQRARYLPRMVTGELIGAYALTEPTAGSDALSSRTRAVLEPGGGAYRLSGVKQFITNGGIADVFVLYAKVDGTQFTCFLVDRETPGFTVGPEEHKLGIRGSSTTSLFLDGVRVPRENVLGEIGRGHVVALNILNVGRLKLAAGCVGAAKRALRQAVAYATERVQFGRPIASFGLMKQKIASMATRLYLAESMVYRTGGLLDDALSGCDLAGPEGGRDVARALEEYAPECAINKVFASEMLDFVVDEMVQIYGGYGFIEDYPASRAYRDSRINRLYEGTNEINRLLISGQLLRRAAAGRLPLLDAARRAAETLDQAAGVAIPIGPDIYDRGGLDPLARMRTAALACLGRAVNRLGTALNDHQEILAWLSDQMITVFAVESGILRARQDGAAQADGPMAQIADHATAVAVPRVRDPAVQIVAAAQDREAAARDLAGIHRLLDLVPPDPVVVPRAIADHVLETGGYSLGLPAV